jgi:hypothetical protein
MAYDAPAVTHLVILGTRKLNGNGDPTLQALVDMCELSGETMRFGNPPRSLF